MRTLLILGLCATAMVANARTAKTDTVNRYIINGQTISNFNGTQLQGKTVTSYNVATENERNRVVVTHNITTDIAEQKPAQSSTPNFSFVNRGDNNSEDYLQPFWHWSTLKIVDGVEVAEIPAYKLKDIASASVYGSWSPEAKKYGEKGKNGVVIVETRASKSKIDYSDQPDNMVIIDKDDSGKLPLKIVYKKHVRTESSFGGNHINFEFEASDKEKPFNVVVATGAFDDYVLFVDGEKTSTMPAANNIAIIDAFAPGTEKAKAITSDGKGAVFIETKTNKKIYIVDGMRVSAADMKSLDNRNIKSVEVLKGESAKAYTDDPNVGVFIVKTKK